MNFKKIDILLGMKDIQRLPNTPPITGGTTSWSMGWW